MTTERIPRVELTNDPAFPLRLVTGLDDGLLLTSQQATEIRVDLMMALPQIIAEEQAARAREELPPSGTQRWKRAHADLEEAFLRGEIPT